MKDVIFIDSALEDLQAFPQIARREAGYQIDRVQQGLDPMDWKPMKRVGAGVREIRIHVAGEHRVLYIAKFEDALYVLHAFRKKTQKMGKKDIALAAKRYQILVRERNQR